MENAAWRLCGILTWALSATASPAVAQDNYPAFPIRIVVAYAPGASDIAARVLAQKLSAQMNANIFVENKPGASGNIGSEFVAKSKPNGYTLLYNTNGVVLSRAMGDKLGYDLLTDFLPVTFIGSAPYVLFTNPSVPADTPAEFIAYLKANPDKLAYGSSGNGSGNHLGPLLFLQANGLVALHVPYKGAAEATNDLIAGRIQFSMQGATAMLQLVNTRRVKALAIAGLKRSPLLPDVPTLNETVVPGFEVGGWYGVLAPAQTPPAIVKRLNGEIVKALQDPDLKSRLAQEGMELVGSTPEEYSAYLRRELERWTKLIKSAGVKP